MGVVFFDCAKTKIVVNESTIKVKRQRFFNARGGGLQRFTELDDVAALGHRDT
jgi:hypothetical protein